MKKCSSLNILIAICAILIVLLCVGAFVYKPHFSDSLSGNNADWGNFGDFFWGLGTMLLTALNVYMVYNINNTIERSRRAKDKFEIEKAIITEFKSLRDKCLTRVNANVFNVDTQYIAQLESFIRELRRYENIFPFLRENRKRESLNILQQRLRYMQDQNSLDEWRRTHSQEEWDSFNGVMYLHSELILGNMTSDWYETVNESLQAEM